MRVIFLILFLFSAIGLLPFVDAQIIPITLSHTMNDVIFDGKWTFAAEWKASSQDTIKTNQSQIHIRTAHQGEFVFVMLDVVADKTPTVDDFALICIDNSINNVTKKNMVAYCFQINVGNDNPTTFYWDELKQDYELVDNHMGLVSVGGISDENDRYTPIPHSSYEFKIPLELFQRYDKYGFFVGMFDSENTTTYTWPNNININLKSGLPSPQRWGEIYSPDKSLPEYELPILILVVTFSLVIFINSRKNILIFSV